MNCALCQNEIPEHSPTEELKGLSATISCKGRTLTRHEHKVCSELEKEWPDGATDLPSRAQSDFYYATDPKVRQGIW